MATRVFAVDLGGWSVKLAVASPGIRGASLINVIERLVPPPSESNPEPVEHRQKLVLAAMIDELRLRDETGYLGVYGDQVFTQILEFGFKNLRRAELDKAVGGELEGVVPVDLEEMVYCFEPIPAPPPVAPDAVDPGAMWNDGPTRIRGRVAAPSEGMRVLTYAMRRDRAEQLIELGKSCGFDPRGVLAVGGAAVRLVERTPSLAKARVDGPVAVIDVGHDRTDVSVIYTGKCVFSRSFARAGKQVTEAISRHWQMPFDRAEQAKHADGFVASQAEPANSPQWQKISQVLSTELASFTRDLRQTLAACRARTGFTPLAGLLVGGGARLRGIGSFLSEQLGIPMWRLTQDDAVALAGPRVTPEQVAALPIDSSAMTVGMAYDAAGGRPQFDLRQGSLAKKMDLSFLRAKAVPLGAAVLAIAAFAAVSAYADLYRLRKAEKTLTTRLATESQEVLGSVKSADDVLNSTSAGGGPSSSPIPKVTAYDLLLEINSHVPPKDKMTLDVDKLDIDETKIDMSGTAKTPEELDLLVTELKKSDCFKEVTRGATEVVDNGVRKFRLTINPQCER
jgi:Tfp pilus assembly PilM family ATPase